MQIFKKKKIHFRRLSDGYLCHLSDDYSLYPSLHQWHEGYFLRKKWLTVAYPTALLSLNRWHEGYFLKKNSLPLKKFCCLTDALHLTDSKLRCRLTDRLEICRITDDKFPMLKKNHSVVHATGKCQKSDNTAVEFLVKM